jgi:hypothetical protein
VDRDGDGQCRVDNNGGGRGNGNDEGPRIQCIDNDRNGQVSPAVTPDVPFFNVAH